VLVTAAVVPGPPAFVGELMGSAAHELDDLRHAADQVVSRTLSGLLSATEGLPSVDSDSDSDSDLGLELGPGPGVGSDPVQLVVVGPGRPGEFDAAGPVSFTGFGRDVVVPALVEGRRGDRRLPTPIMVARYLASRDLAAHPEHVELWASARWITTSGADASVLGKRLRAVGTQVALVLVADGADCHGPKAPRAEDPRAQAYDDEVCAALASGEPGRLAQIDVDLGEELGATGQRVWPVLVAAAGGDEIGEVLWAGAPYGVGWVVASWRKPDDQCAGDEVNYL
jgi:hypothetical protein